MSIDLETIVVDGLTRKLGWVKPATPEKANMRALKTSLRTLRANNGLSPTIPREQWLEADFITPFDDPRFILDQRSSGGCTGWAGAGAMMRQRAMRGFDYKRLSGACTYAQINGGRDDGSNIIDCMRALTEKGTCLESEMDFPRIYASQIPSDATWFKMDEHVTLSDFDDYATALQMGMLPEFPLNAGGLRQFNGEGVARFVRGGSNHAVYAARLKRLMDGQWVLGMVNSWAYTWGPFRKGWCWITEDHVDYSINDDDSFAIAAPRSQAA